MTGCHGHENFVQQLWLLQCLYKIVGANLSQYFCMVYAFVLHTLKVLLIASRRHLRTPNFVGQLH